MPSLRISYWLIFFFRILNCCSVTLLPLFSLLSTQNLILILCCLCLAFCFQTTCERPTSLENVIIETFTQHLLSARHCAKCFTWVNSFNSQNSLMRQIEILCPLYKWGTLQFQKDVTNCLRTYSRNWQSRFEPRFVGFHSLCANHWKMVLHSGEDCALQSHTVFKFWIHCCHILLSGLPKWLLKLFCHSIQDKSRCGHLCLQCFLQCPTQNRCL